MQYTENQPQIIIILLNNKRLKLNKMQNINKNFTPFTLLFFQAVKQTLQSLKQIF